MALIKKHAAAPDGYKTYCMAVSSDIVRDELIHMGCELFEFAKNYEVLFIPSNKQLDTIRNFIHNSYGKFSWWIAGTKANRKDTEDLLNKYGNQDLNMFLDKIDENIDVH